MKWITKFRYHCRMAKLYTSLLRDEYKERYPNAYAFADKKFRYRMLRSIALINDHISKMEKGLS